MLSLAGTFLQVVPAPLGGYLGALGITGRRLSVTDSAGRVHLFAIKPAHAAHTIGGLCDHPVAAAAEAASSAANACTHRKDAADATSDGGSEVSTDGREAAVTDEAARLAAERRARVELAAQATDMRGVLQVLTQDDIHWLLPAAYADAANHPEFYQFPPPRSD